MSCDKNTSENNGDCLEVESIHRPFDVSDTAWLIGQGVRYLNSSDKEGELAYQRVIELLRHCSKDLLKTVIELFQQAKSGDTPLRWGILYILGDAGDSNAADFLIQTTLKQLPEAHEGCESSRDTEILICVMAVHALQKIAGRYPDSSEALLKIISEKPVKPILIEAVKSASKLGLEEKVRELLPKEEHWILDIRKARTEELFAEPEREDIKERGFTPPKKVPLYTAPQITYHLRKEE